MRSVLRLKRRLGNGNGNLNILQMYTILVFFLHNAHHKKILIYDMYIFLHFVKQDYM